MRRLKRLDALTSIIKVAEMNSARSKFSSLVLSLTAGIVSLMTSGCVSGVVSDRMTVGTAQRFIRIGMTSSEVLSAMGSPNLVTTDEKRRETWAYDKVSTEAVDTSSSLSGGLLAGGLGINPGFFTGSHRYNRSSRTQKTLTIIVKFDEKAKVRDFAYHSSTF
jgi:outer membrane protein assembly factor BamE (lipoprotein component of BamABCDE complex)